MNPRPMTPRARGTAPRRSWLTVGVAVVVLALLATALLWWLEPVLQKGASAGLWWRNVLPLWLVALLVFGVAGRLLFTIWFTTCLTWLLFTVNGIKVSRMNAPIMPGDWALREQLANNMDFFSHYTGNATVIVVAVVALLVLGAVLWRLERRWPRAPLGARLVLLVLPALLLFTAFHGDGPWPRAYSDAALVGYQPWDPVASDRHTGLLAGLVRMTQEARVDLPAADPRVVADFAQASAADLQQRTARAVPAELPDIVIVQSEAFFAPAIMKQIEPGQFAPQFERLAATGISGSLHTPAYGGGTIRTEFETLTGYPMSAFPSISYPYYGLAARWMPSVPRRLQAFGYTTTLLHPFRGDFWNRQEVMPKLGFQQSYYEKAFAKAHHVGLYVADQDLFDAILDRLDTPASAPRYLMAITMENHGPWGREAKDLPHALDGMVLPTGLNEKGSKQLTYYLSHLVNGDAALGRFAQRLLARPHWTVLLFYGDHLPSLDDAFATTGFDDGRTYGAQDTRYMLLSNRPLAPRQLNLSAYELPSLLFDALNLPEDGYLAFDGAIRAAETADGPTRKPHYGQVSINAARMEVRCKRKLTAAGTCSAHAG